MEQRGYVAHEPPGSSPRNSGTRRCPSRCSRRRRPSWRNAANIKLPQQIYLTLMTAGLGELFVAAVNNSFRWPCVRVPDFARGVFCRNAVPSLNFSSGTVSRSARWLAKLTRNLVNRFSLTRQLHHPCQDHSMFDSLANSVQSALLSAQLRFEGDVWGHGLTLSVAVAGAAALVCWVGQVTTGYWSWVDRLWSILPFAYVAIFAAYTPSSRLLLMAGLACAWAARLTANFARKGGYGSEEDYRWAILRAWFAKHDPLHPLGRELFSLLFVALYQNVLLWLIAAPAAFVVAQAASPSLQPADYVLAAAFLVGLAVETATDEQQWAFQSRKHSMTQAERERAGGDYARGFLTSGVFRVSRHLNFFAEQSLWWILYLFTVASGAPIFNWTAVGPTLLSLLFLGSTTMTESVSVSKYPAYRAYQRTTSRLLPWFPGTSLDSPAGQALVVAATARAGKGDKQR